RARRGEHLDLRRTLRGSLRTGGDPMTLARQSRRTRPRRLVLLCDISGSMEPYARAYLHLLTSAVASGAPAEAFVFATRLTRLTRALGGRNPDAAIQRAVAAAPDWSSGTRIGEALRSFNDSYGRRGMARGAVVVILSDGWERADPALLEREMERLGRLAHRVIWVNPRAGASGFSPGTGGMAAALPHCDALLSGHSLGAMEEVAEVIAADQAPARTALAATERPAAPEEPSWPSAERTEAQRPVPMPSGYGPKRGRTTE
ncbi:MAG TPA: VWA domain-containing protein, partial [Solirubrobacterales bacterium]|nr:VWA domain-containing protein [Solirubrobacterales bacterium]